MSEYHRLTLDNGLRVISVPMPHHHSAEIMVCLGVGSRHESARRAGASHFLEHMLFKGSADYPTGLELERAFEALGGSANAATDAETTCFHSRIHPEHVARGIDLFASMLRRPLFQGIEVERRIILEEALADLSESGRQINPDNLIAGLLFPGHPLGRPTLGSRASIERLAPAQLEKHYAAYYTPPNLVLTVAGPIDAAEVFQAARTSFGDWQGAAPPPARPWVDTGETGPELRWVRDTGSQVAMQFAFQLPGRNAPQAVDLRVWRRILGWGGMSRLMMRLREELGLTYAVDAGLALYTEVGLLAVELAVSPENLFQATQAILDIFSELIAEPIPEQELDHALRSYRYDLEYSRDQVEEMALRYGWGEITGCMRTIVGDFAALENISAETLQSTARSLFVPAGLRAAIVGPYRTGDRKAVEKLVAGWRP